jgi:hypothetical protein
MFALLTGVAGIIWWGTKISTEGSVVIGMLIGAITIIGSAYLGVYLTYIRTSGRRQRWPGEKNDDEDTLVP